jgi:hypothetical protein
MALVIAIIGLAHAKICHKDNNQADCGVDDTGVAAQSSEGLSHVVAKS